MADDYIRLPTDGLGKKVDSEKLNDGGPSGGNDVERTRQQVAGRNYEEVADVKLSDPDPSTAYALITRPLNVTSPVRNTLSSSALAALASVNLDGAAVALSKTGKLMKVVFAASVPCKWRIGLVSGAIFGVSFTQALETGEWSPPDKRFDTAAAADAFRISVTNLDRFRAADVYATLYWDETD